jgi:hypothetical protein
MNEFKKILYNCKKATLLVEKKAFTKITFREEIELRIHLLGCNVCALYKKQSKMINDRILQLYNGGGNGAKEYHLNDTYKKQMQDKIDEELNK